MLSKIQELLPGKGRKEIDHQDNSWIIPILVWQDIYIKKEMVLKFLSYILYAKYSTYKRHVYRINFLLNAQRNILRCLSRKPIEEDI